MPEKRWVLRNVDNRVVTSLTETLGVPEIIARLLVLRDLAEPESAKRFLSCSLRSDLPSPHRMAGMDLAVERLAQALERQEPVCVWGDYDVDGTTGASALVNFLREIGLKAHYYVPHRIEEGYGLNCGALQELGSQGIFILVTVDCGISNVEEVKFARDKGIDVIIVDHHEPPPELPPALAILNPHRSDCLFPDKGLSGAGLAFYLVIGLRAKLREMGTFKSGEVPDIRRYLDIITLGTIADMVPLRGVNRVLVRRGLQELGLSQRPGILALKQVAGIPEGEIGVGHVAFQLGPRINAAGRMDTGLKVVEMLTTDSMEVAQRVARELDNHNRERQVTEARVLEEALAQIEEEPSFKDSYSIAVGREGWHPGVLGIVASRLVERYHRPSVVIGFDGGEGKGSARSIRGFHIVDGFRECADLLKKYGGHEYAGGLTLTQENFPLFVERFERIARERLSLEDLQPLLQIDAELDFNQIRLSTLQQLDSLRPFGIGNPEPIFMTGGVEVIERNEFARGVRFRVRKDGRTVGAVIFGETSSIPGRRGESVDVAYRLSKNEWNGTLALELRLADLRISEYS